MPWCLSEMCCWRGETKPVSNFSRYVYWIHHFNHGKFRFIHNKWFNPSTGTYVNHGNATNPDQKDVFPIPRRPDINDWILLLKAV